jgi:hypothetical protein
MSGAVPPLFHVPSWYEKKQLQIPVHVLHIKMGLSTHVCNFCRIFTFISSQSVPLHENHSTSGLAKGSVFESVL